MSNYSYPFHFIENEGLRREEETLQPSIYLNKYVSFLQALLYFLTHCFVLPLVTHCKLYFIFSHTIFSHIVLSKIQSLETWNVNSF